MQITINTNDILGDEETIRDEVIEQVTATLSRHILQTSEQQMEQLIAKSLEATVAAKVDELVRCHLDTEFTVTDSYGRKGTTETMRTRIGSIIAAQCEFKKKTYSSDQNVLTNIVEEEVKKEVNKFQSEFNSLVTRQVMDECLKQSVATLRKACGLKS